MLKAVYKNPKTGKLYAFHKENEESTERPDIYTVFDNKDSYAKGDFQVDKNGKAYKVLDVEFHTTKKGYKVLQVKED